MKYHQWVVMGAGGFIGGHLVKRLLGEGRGVMALDKKPLDVWWQLHQDAASLSVDCRNQTQLYELVYGNDVVVDLAADMGGMGYILSHPYECMLSAEMAINTVKACKDSGVARAVFASSACVYPYGVYGRLPETLATEGPLDVPEGAPRWEPGYGLEKLYSEQLFLAAGYSAVRFHNVYGSHGSWCDGREKAPAAICRKVAAAKLRGEHSIELWGSTEQVRRTFLHVDDAIDAVIRLVESSESGPFNVGSEDMVTVAELAWIIMDIAGHKCDIQWVDGPIGAPCRCSHNDLIESKLGWTPSVTLKCGLTDLYAWIEEQVQEANSQV